MTTKMRIGDLLVEAKLITESQINSALEIKKKTGSKEKLGNLLVDLGVISEEQMIEVLCKKLNTTFVKLQGQPISEKLPQMIPEETAREKLVFPYKFQNNILYVATNDPLDYETLNHISTVTGKAIEAVIATRSDISDAINRYYNKQRIDSIASVLNTTASASEALSNLSNIDFDDVESRVGSVPVVKFINDLIAQAHAKRASDIHIEPSPEEVRIRFRIDGELVEIVRMSIKAHPSIVTRVKIMSGMDIAEKRIPLDGRFKTEIDKNTVSVRAASMPTIYGEKIVLRLMTDAKGEILPLEALGIKDDAAAQLRAAIKNPNGLILVTGPTGSGKSTTLYSLLNELSEVGVNVITIEDPVEKALPGVNQTQVNVKAGLTFASGLRAVLRQDPDKIMIGEIRDVETADIAARAAITGHLVLASMHTNSAAASYMRLVDMGIEPYIIASSVIAVMAQRLVRLLCPHCKETYQPAQADINFLSSFKVDPGVTLYRSKGCNRCEFTGNLGRTCVKEVILTDSAIRDMVVAKAKAADIDDYLLREKGMRFMLDDAVSLVTDGKIFIRELLNLTQYMES